MYIISLTNIKIYDTAIGCVTEIKGDKFTTLHQIKDSDIEYENWNEDMVRITGDIKINKIIKESNSWIWKREGVIERKKLPGMEPGVSGSAYIGRTNVAEGIILGLTKNKNILVAGFTKTEDPEERTGNNDTESN